MDDKQAAGPAKASITGEARKAWAQSDLRANRAATGPRRRIAELTIVRFRPTCLCFAVRLNDVGELSTMEAAEQLAAFSAQTKTKLEQWKSER
jgi:hypothetical protein